jgi:hypothetical protein
MSAAVAVPPPPTTVPLSPPPVPTSADAASKVALEDRDVAPIAPPAKAVFIVAIALFEGLAHSRRHCGGARDAS